MDRPLCFHNLYVLSEHQKAAGADSYGKTTQAQGKQREAGWWRPLSIPATHGTVVCFIFHLMPQLKQVELKAADKGRHNTTQQQKSKT